MKMRDNGLSSTKIWIQKKSSYLIATITLLPYLYISVYFNRGLDLTDESYYIYSTVFSNDVIFFVSSYHNLLKIIFRICSDIFILRLFFLFIIFTMAVFLSSKIYILSNQKRFIFNSKISFIISISCLTPLFEYRLFLTTPNYNLLALIGALATTIGVAENLRAGGPRFLQSTAPSVFGLALVILAKPPAGATILVGYIVFQLLVGGKAIRFAILCCLGVAIVLAGFPAAVGKSIPEYTAMILDGWRSYQILDAGHKMDDLLDLPRIQISKVEFSFCLIILAAPILAKLKLGGLIRLGLPNLSLLLCGLVTLVALVAFMREGIDATSFSGQLVVIAPMIALFIRFASVGFSLRNPGTIIHIWLLALPFILAFGSNNNFWLKSTNFAIFWSISIIFLYLIKNKSNFLLLGTAQYVIILNIIVVSGFGMLRAIEKPYRQSVSIYSQNTPIFLPQKMGVLYVSKSVSDYIAEFKSVVQKSEFQPNSYMLDLTGQSPGVMMLIEARPLGTAWLYGGYRGSDDFARFTISKAGCRKFSSSWILIEEAGSRSISADVLGGFGASLSTDYSKAGQLIVPAGISERTNDAVQIIYKPIRPPAAAESACRLKINSPN